MKANFMEWLERYADRHTICFGEDVTDCGMRSDSMKKDVQWFIQCF